MGLWEFDDFKTEDLIKIKDANDILREYNLGMDEEAEREIMSELANRESLQDETKNKDDSILNKVDALMRKQGQFAGIEEDNEFGNAPEDPLLRQKVWDEGEHIEDYPCDSGVDENGEMVLESNGSIEHKIRYEGQIYLLHTDYGADPKIYNF